MDIRRTVLLQNRVLIAEHFLATAFYVVVCLAPDLPVLMSNAVRKRKLLCIRKHCDLIIGHRQRLRSERSVYEQSNTQRQGSPRRRGSNLCNNTKYCTSARAGCVILSAALVKAKRRKTSARSLAYSKSFCRRRMGLGPGDFFKPVPRTCCNVRRACCQYHEL